MTVCKPASRQQGDSFTPAHRQQSSGTVPPSSLQSDSFGLTRGYVQIVVIVHMHQEVFLL